ncbi:hypothetical protein WA588_001434 [Blastocystis sp. NMH]
MELNTVLDRIKGFSGVIGYVIVNKKAEIVHTTLTQEEAISLAAVTIKMIGDSNDALHEFVEDNAEFITIRSKARDILIVPGRLCRLAATKATCILSRSCATLL